MIAKQPSVKGGAPRTDSASPNGNAWLGGASAGGDAYSVVRHGRLVSVSRPAADLSMERFLRAAQGQERFFWRDGRRGIELAGMGMAAHLMGYGSSRFAAIQRQARQIFAHAAWEAFDGGHQTSGIELARPRLFGGFSFLNTFAPDGVWTGFHPAFFILPHYQLVTQSGQSWLTINVLLSPDEDTTANLPLLHEALGLQIELLQDENGIGGQANSAALPRTGDAGQKGVDIDFPLSFAEWGQLIENARQAFANSPMEKVVLSRVAQLRARQPIEVLSALTLLCARYPDCFNFLFEPQPGHAFLGATPELLVRVRGAEVESMALAGSIRRGANEAEDAELAKELLSSAKDLYEHGLVTNALRRRLQPLSSQLNIPDSPSVLTLNNIHHLHTPVKAKLKDRDGVLPLVNTLHPTPALGGAPRELALEFIRGHERRLRGWYAAPVGWVDSSMDGAFAVAIRSAVVQKERCWAYAGAGIVSDSVPQQEWEETGWKFQPMINSMVDSQPA